MPLNPYEETLLEQEDENPYRDTLRLQNQQAESALRVSAKQAADISPDRQAEVLELSRRTNLPASVIHRNFDAIRKRAEIADTGYARMLRESPKLAEWLSDPGNMALAKDDLRQLGMLDWLLTRGRDYLGSVVGGAIGQVGGTLLSGAGELYGVATRAVSEPLRAILPEPAMRVLEKPILPWWGDPAQILKRPGEELKATGEFYAPPPERQTLGTDIAAGVGQLGGQIAVALLGGPVLSTASLYAQGADIMSEKIRGDAAPQAEKDIATIAGAGVTALTERFGLDLILNRVPPAIRNRALRQLADVVIAGGAEAGQEFSEALLQDVARRFLTNEQAPLLEGVTREMAAAGGAGALARAIFTSATGVRLRHHAEAQRQFFDALSEGVKNSKTFQRLPEAAQRLILEMTKDGPVENVYLPAEDIQTYAQSVNMDPGDYLESVTPGGKQAFDEAQGADVPVPLADYATKILQSEAAGHFTEAARFGDPEAMNLREAKAFEQENQTTPERTALPEAEIDQSAGRVREDIVGQMTGMGLEPALVHAYARVHERFFRTLGTRLGVDPFERYTRYQLKITRPLPEILRTMPDVDTRLDPLIDRLRSGKLPAQEEMFGTSLANFLREKGGVKDEGGDLASREPDIGRKPFETNLIQPKTGIPLDRAREMAAEEGYVDSQSSIADFLDAIDKELRGEPVFAQGRENPQAIEQSIVLEQMAQYLKDRDIDVRKATNEEIRKVLKEAAAETQARDIDARTGEVLEQGAMPKTDPLTGLPLHADGTVTLYHHTNEEAAAEIRRTGELKSAGEPDIYLTTRAEPDTGYGDSVVAVRVRPDQLLLDDEFPGGRKDFRIEVGPGRALKVKVEPQSASLRDRSGEKPLRRYWQDTSFQAGGLPIENELQTAVRIPDSVPLLSIPATESFAEEKSSELRRRAVSQVDRLAGHRDERRAKPGVVRNHHTGWHIDLTKDGLKKAAHFVNSAHRLVAFENLPRLIQDGTFLRDEADRDDPKSGLRYAYIYAPFTWNRGAYIAKIALKQGRRGASTFYTLHAVEVGKSADFNPDLLSSATAEPQHSVVSLGASTEAEGAGVTPPATISTAELYTFVNQARQTATHLFQDTAFDLEKRGDIVFSPDRKVSIRLLEKTDASTFLHESAHFFLEVFGDLVDELRPRLGTLDETQQRMVSDYDKLLEKLGVKSRAEIGKEQHEYFARSFEAYLREGKAPSPELRSVFRRFKDWLARIYKSLTQLKVELDPEVHAIFDRLLATDEEIQRARFDAGIEAMIQDNGMAKRLGMTDEDFRLYGEKVRDVSDREKEALFDEYMDEYGERQKEWYIARRRETREQVAQEVHSQRGYIALAFLKDGTLPDGAALPEGIQKMKLDARALEAQYGTHKESSIMRRLRRLDVYRVKDGVHPDMVAEILGYSSGDEMIQDLVKLRPMNALIEAETDDRMRQSYGDMLTDGTAAEKARDAVMTEGRAELAEREAVALARAQRQAEPFVKSGERRAQRSDREARRAGLRDIRQFVPSVALARHIAEGRIREKKVRDLRPGLYYAAARREGNLAIEAVNRGDFAQALQHKQQELINIEMYRAAREAQKNVEGIRKYMRSFDETKKRERIGKAGEDYLDQIDALRDRFDFARITEKANQRRQKLAKWIAAREADGLPVDIPQELIDESSRENYRNLTVEQLAGLRDTVKHIEHLARLKNRLLKAKEKREFDAAAAAVAGSIAGNSKGPRPVVIEDELPGEDAKRGLAGFFAWQRKLPSLVRQMDGGQDGGAVWEYLMRPINAAADEETTMKEAAGLRISKIFKMYSRQELAAMSRKEYIPAIRTSLSKEARIMVALYYGNAEGRQRLQGGHGWGEAEVSAILNSLDRKDFEFVQAMWKEVNSYWDEIAAKERRVRGVAPEKVEAVSYMTPFGEMPGGYVPLKYAITDPQTQAHSAAEIAKRMMRGAFTRSTTRRGHTEQRQETVNRRLRLSLNTIWEHTNEVIHDLTHHEMLIDVNRLLGRKDVQGAIVSHYGDIVLRNMQDAIKDIAAGYVPVQQFGEHALEWARQGTSIALMAWNATTALTQPLGLTVSFVRIGPKWAARGVAHWLGDAVRMESTAKWIHQQSAFMRDRHLNLSREIQEVRSKVHPRGSLVAASIGRFAGAPGARAALEISNVHGVIEDTYFSLISKMQAVADIPTWLGAFDKALSEGNDDTRAVALADQAVIDSQGSGHIKDLAKAQRATPAMKIFTQFMSYFSVVYNQTAEAKARARLNDPVKTAKLASDLLMLLVVPMILETALRDAIKGRDEDEPWWLELLKNEASYILNTIVFAREFSGAVQGFEYKGTAGAGVFAEASGFIKQVLQWEADEAFWKALNETGGIVFHLPATFVERSVEAFLAAEQGAAAAIRTLIAGKIRE